MRGFQLEARRGRATCFGRAIPVLFGLLWACEGGGGGNEGPTESARSPGRSVPMERSP